MTDSQKRTERVTPPRRLAGEGSASFAPEERSLPEPRPLPGRNFFRAAIFLCGFLQIWALRFYIEPDGVNYLDLSRELLQRHWAHAVNAFWSPLLPWVLALMIRVTRVGPYGETTLLHLVNFAFFLGSLFAFEFFLAALLRRERAEGPGARETGRSMEFTWWTFGYALFLYAGLFITPAYSDSPDILVNAALFLAAGLILRLDRPYQGWGKPALLGVVLALGYLAKAILFPLAFVFLFSAYLVMRRERRPVLRTGLAAATFLALSAPWIVALSGSVGHATFGESGRVAYWLYSHDLTSTYHWHGEFPEAGRPLHPIHLALASPAVDTFTDPVGGSYPPLFDLYYWYAGAVARFSLHGQLAILRQTLPAFVRVLSAEKELLVGFFALLILEGNRRRYFLALARLSPVWLPCLGAFALYGLVHVESRFLGGFLVLAWCALFAAFRRSEEAIAPRVIGGVTLAVSAVLAAVVLLGTLGYAADVLHPRRDVQREVGEGLRRMGLERGDRVAVIGAPTTADYWAHGEELHVVADIAGASAAEFWEAPSERKAAVYDLMRQAGARAIVTDTRPATGLPPEWRALEGTGYAVHLLPPD